MIRICHFGKRTTYAPCQESGLPSDKPERARRGEGGGHNGTTWSAVGSLALRLLWAINTARVGVWRVYKLAVNYRYAICGAGAELGP